MGVYGTILFRSFLVYFLIVVIFRIMGKREIGELGIVDLVVFVMMADIAVIAIENYDGSLWKFILPMGALVFIQIASSWLSLKSRSFRRLVDSEPSIIIKNGKINERIMKKQRYNYDDLLMQLRQKNVRYISDVEYAILEPTGKLSVFEKDKNKKKPQKFSIGLMVDGEVQEDKLNDLNITKKWLFKELDKRGIKDLKKISFCSYDDGKLYIDFIDQE